jgi:hypothetical protein
MDRRPSSTFSLGAVSIDTAPRKRAKRPRSIGRGKEREEVRTRNLARLWLILGVALLVGVLLAGVAMAKRAQPHFEMVRSESAVARDCLKKASASVQIRSTPVGNQIMDVTLKHAAKNTAFTLFVIQQPNAPFGISWYQGDISTDNKGNGSERFIGIFNDEVFAIAPGSVKAPQVDDQDAQKNPKFKPVHTFHLGLWFADPKEAKDAGCSGKVTPFDGDHEAGIQALSTRNFPDLRGPLGEKRPSKVQAPLGEIK